MIIKIEELMPNDIIEIHKIQKMAFKDAFDKYHFCPAFEATEKELTSFLMKAVGYKIVCDGKIVGSIFICKISLDHYELDTMSINPQFQNLGIGCKAIAQLEKIHPNVLTWTLSTPDSDGRNRHLYEKFGYKQVGTESINKNLKLIKYKKELDLVR